MITIPEPIGFISRDLCKLSFITDFLTSSYSNISLYPNISAIIVCSAFSLVLSGKYFSHTSFLL